ncbi:CDP-diacylglycerol-inositol 3-phosphatidyltransferase [Salpingoeca rosetta]|uniref:CDP-diacylglycerol--inositol 3-phosphatidyltransferase n=1 Tax=Salpingoeca rosetta (strain ATCC 50818 / BSB-021) TaxID=946362 RepID=F2UIM8_SALR5|nr:CDP-diacylglycerol-inositol 3-phosphatidyltransferase [Salpingoeca rosetta]EGD77077.1 CDP-diacylglycerol-inositol 3-phosphatidyltransferase [Salpingoeca rosetta]|eukprot:XP_004990917.1 CDP-diacylglycerol-inositol 3-phosphatidyltransferase [Salpingoeca rosetta]
MAATAVSRKKKGASPNIFLYIPNLIGFARVALLIASLFFMTSNPYVAMSLYWLSAFIDAFDGMAARHFNQCTIFGSVLDMVTDRVTTLCLMMTCGQFYPQYMVAFQLLAVLDISSHWLQMYSSMLSGKTSHKFIKLEENALLRYYYTKPVLFTLCSANELFFMALYFAHFNINGPEVVAFSVSASVREWIGWITFPLFALKHLISLIQLVAAASNVAKVDADNTNLQNKAR